MGWGYWGDYGQINVGISSGYVDTDNENITDKRHYHKQGFIYIVVIQGSGQIEVNGQPITISQNQVLAIEPGEVYRYLAVIDKPFQWITFCTSKDAEDKVVVE